MFLPEKGFNDMTRSTVENLNSYINKKVYRSKNPNPDTEPEDVTFCNLSFLHFHLPHCHYTISIFLTIYTFLCISLSLAISIYLLLWLLKTSPANLALLRRGGNSIFSTRKRFVPKKKRISIAAVWDHTFAIFQTPTYARYSLQYMKKIEKQYNKPRTLEHTTINMSWL